VIPPAVRDEVVLRRAGYCCEDCGARERLTLHHLRYFEPMDRYPGDPESGGGPIDGLEIPEDLAALCWECHQGRHRDMNGEYWRDPEDRADYWSGFHQEMDRQ